MTADLWGAVDRLTLPTRIPVERAVDADWLIDVAVEQADIATGRRDGACSVPAYRAAIARAAAATTATASVPGLWQQAIDALGTGTEGSEGSPSVPLRERSPADLDLMEIMGQVRDAVRSEFARLGRPLPSGWTVGVSEIRELAELVTVNAAEWAARFASWGRALETYLHAARSQPKPFRLRSTPCPLCKTEWVRINERGLADANGDRLGRPIKVDFAAGKVRAAVCEACGVGWFRGADLHRLAALIGATPDTDTERMTG